MISYEFKINCPNCGNQKPQEVGQVVSGKDPNYPQYRCDFCEMLDEKIAKIIKKHNDGKRFNR